MARVRLALLSLLCAACSTSAPAPERAAAPAPAPQSAPQLSQYEARIAPILAERCTACHGAEKHKAKLALHTSEAIEKGSESGPVIVAGHPEASELVKRLKLPLAHDDHMPPKDHPQPSAEEIATLEAWIAQGASFTSRAEPGARPAAPQSAKPAPVATETPAPGAGTGLASAKAAPASSEAIAAPSRRSCTSRRSDPRRSCPGSISRPMRWT